MYTIKNGIARKNVFVAILENGRGKILINKNFYIKNREGSPHKF